jgi:hypothetical protein
MKFQQGGYPPELKDIFQLWLGGKGDDESKTQTVSDGRRITHGFKGKLQSE